MTILSRAQYSRFLLCVVVCSCILTTVRGERLPPPPRKMVAVEGVVYCKVCARDPNNSFHRVATLAPLAAAVVKLQCNNTNKSWEEQMKTDNNGDFVFTPEKVSSWGAHKCKIFLVSSSRSDCTAPTAKPYFDDTPWRLGFALTKTNATSSLQYYTTARQLLYYSYWPDCI